MSFASRQQADVLIVGAGPSGSSAAIALAAGGASVVLADRCAFPRDKVCGDALIPDALRALDRVSLTDSVLARGRALRAIRIHAPNGRFVDIPGRCACVPRAVLDDVIRAEAVRRGARFLPDYQLHRASTDGGCVTGATLAGRDGRTIEVEAAVTLLATGAAAEPLKRFNVCERVGPSATAARIYVKADARYARDFDRLCISYDRAISPGYGWIFPGPDDVFNVGVGYFYDAKARPPDTNVRALLDRFLTTFPPAIELMTRSRLLTPLKGAPLRTALTGAKLAMPGLLVIGEAAGLTYSLSGEGIGKAMESGLVAADLILERLRTSSLNAVEVARGYERRIRSALTARFKAYKAAQDWLANPRIANLLAWRADRSRFVRRQLAALFQETVDPSELFSAAGVMRSFLS